MPQLSVELCRLQFAFPLPRPQTHSLSSLVFSPLLLAGRFQGFCYGTSPSNIRLLGLASSTLLGTGTYQSDGTFHISPAASESND